jgi:hypothetical protein
MHSPEAEKPSFGESSFFSPAVPGLLKYLTRQLEASILSRRNKTKTKHTPEDVMTHDRAGLLPHNDGISIVVNVVFVIIIVVVVITRSPLRRNYVG